MPMTMSVIVCAYDEEATLAACLHSVLAQTRMPDEVIVVDNASTDRTGEVARGIRGVIVVDEPTKGLVVARETGRRAATGDVLVNLDADCRAPLRWLERIERVMQDSPRTVAVSGPYHFYDWHWWGGALVRVYDWTLAPFAHHKPKHLYSWKTLLKCEKTWPAVRNALVANVDVALTLFRADAWAAQAVPVPSAEVAASALQTRRAALRPAAS